MNSLATLLYITTYAALTVYTAQPSAYMGGDNPFLGGWFVSSNMAFVACWISSVLTSLLFFFRVLAVFKYSRAKKVIFSVSWGLTGCITLPLLYTVGEPSLPPSVCQLYIEEFMPIVTITSCPARPWLGIILLILVAAHNILVFISISHELLGNNTLVGAGNIRTLITGNGLLPVSKSLLRSGQLYVGQVAVFSSPTDLLTPLASGSVGLVFATILIYWEGVGWWMLWSAIHPAAECILSCRVFRTLLLSEGRLESNPIIRTEDVEDMIMVAMDRVDAGSDSERS